MKLGAVYRGEQCVIPRVWRAVSAWERTRGLLGRPTLAANEGMLIEDCRMVHTVGMGYALDLVFLDRHGVVKKLVRQIAPLRIAGSFAAAATLELAGGALAQLPIQVGERLDWRPA